MAQLGRIQRHTRYHPRWSFYSSRPGMVGLYGLVAALLGCLPAVQLTLGAPDGWLFRISLAGTAWSWVALAISLRWLPLWPFGGWRGKSSTPAWLTWQRRHLLPAGPSALPALSISIMASCSCLLLLLTRVSKKAQWASCRMLDSELLAPTGPVWGRAGKWYSSARRSGEDRGKCPGSWSPRATIAATAWRVNFLWESGIVFMLRGGGGGGGGHSIVVAGTLVWIETPASPSLRAGHIMGHPPHLRASSSSAVSCDYAVGRTLRGDCTSLTLP